MSKPGTAASIAPATNANPTSAPLPPIQEKIAQKLKNLKSQQNNNEKQNRQTLAENTTNYSDFTINFLKNLNNNWQTHIQNKIEESTWKTFMDCDPTPNFNITKDISEFTTWLTLQREMLVSKITSVNSCKSGQSGQKVKLRNEINAFMDEIGLGFLWG